MKNKTNLFFTILFSLSATFFAASVGVPPIAANVETRGAPAPSGERAREHLPRTGGLKLPAEAVKSVFDENNVESSTPNTIASTFTERQKLTAADGAANNTFGRDAAISGDTAVVGAAPFSGFPPNAVYVFVRNSAGVWTPQQKLVPSGGAGNEGFGANVDIWGDTIIVGTDGGFGSQLGGAAYIFTRSGATWTQQQRLTASDAAAGDEFGRFVAVSGETAIVGATGDDIGANSNQGSAYVFTRVGATWTEQAKLTAADGAAGDGFGRVAVSGETAIVGAQFDDVVLSDQGSAYVFVRSGSTWTQQQKLVASDNASNSFGGSAAISGDTAIVGKPGGVLGGGSNSPPAAYVFVRSGGTWTQQQKLTASTPALDFFGTSVALSGNTAIVGATEGGFTPGNGSAYVFTRSGATWTQQQRLTASDGGADDGFGASVAISGNTAIVGAPGDDIGANSNQGSAYVFQSPATVRTPFDFDGDGKADISVFRPANGTWYLQQSQAGFTGVAFGQAGDRAVPADYDGDGRADVAVYRGGVWYLQRSQSGFTGVQFGAATDAPVPADYDGDGRAELAVYRPSNGTWYIYNLASNQTGGAAFGASEDKPVAADYDGDGKADLAVFRPPTGTWYLQRSALGFVGVSFGTAEDRPVPADYDGDGKADVAVFRPSVGVWYLQRSALGFTGIAFGLGTDTPTPADYDGDGRADIAVFRSSAGTWYLQQSVSGFTGVAFGAGGDLPAPAAYVP